MNISTFPFHCRNAVQVFRVPADERRCDHNNSFGEKESMRTCSAIMKETGAVIEIATSKDQSLTFLVTGKMDSVMDAREKNQSNFQTQASTKVSIPKEHHKWILGKSGGGSLYNRTKFYFIYLFIYWQYDT